MVLGDPCIGWLVGIRLYEPRRDLLGRPVVGKLRLDHAPQLSMDCQATPIKPTRRGYSGLLRVTRAIVRPSPTPPNLAADRRVHGLSSAPGSAPLPGSLGHEKSPRASRIVILAERYAVVVGRTRRDCESGTTPSQARNPAPRQSAGSTLAALRSTPHALQLARGELMILPTHSHLR